MKELEICTKMNRTNQIVSRHCIESSIRFIMSWTFHLCGEFGVQKADSSLTSITNGKALYSSPLTMRMVSTLSSKWTHRSQVYCSPRVQLNRPPFLLAAGGAEPKSDRFPASPNNDTLPEKRLGGAAAAAAGLGAVVAAAAGAGAEEADSASTSATDDSSPATADAPAAPAAVGGRRLRRPPPPAPPPMSSAPMVGRSRMASVALTSLACSLTGPDAGEAAAVGPGPAENDVPERAPPAEGENDELMPAAGTSITI